MDILTQELLAPILEDSKRHGNSRQEEELQALPLWWLDKSQRNVLGLRVIAAHLDTQMERFRNFPSGVRGPVTEVERQMIEHQSNQAAAISVLSDVVHSTLLIMAEDEERKFSTRFKRAILSAWAGTKSIANRVWNNPAFKILGGLSTIAFVYTAFTVIAKLLGR